MKNWFSKYKDRKKLNDKNIIINNINPKIIPRNHIIEHILNNSTKNNIEDLNKMINNLKKPYDENIPEKYRNPPKDHEKVHQTFCGT